MSTLIPPRTTICLYGDTGHGKTTQALALANHLFKTEGKQSVVFLADQEGSELSYLDHPAISHIYTPTGNRWLWIHRAFCNTGPDGLVQDAGLVIHEGLTAYAEIILAEEGRMAAEGVNIGGGGAYNLTLYPDDVETIVRDERLVAKSRLTEEQLGLTVKLGSNNMAHYGVAQSAIREGLKSARGDVPTLFTAMEGQGKPKGTAPACVGPQTVGDAQTRNIPRWLTYTFRINHKGGKTTLYLHPHDVGPRTEALVNARIPLEGGSVAVPPSITPADLPQAMELLKRRRHAAAQ